MPPLPLSSEWTLLKCNLTAHSPKRDFCVRCKEQEINRTRQSWKDESLRPTPPGLRSGLEHQNPFSPPVNKMFWGISLPGALWISVRGVADEGASCVLNSTTITMRSNAGSPPASTRRSVRSEDWSSENLPPPQKGDPFEGRFSEK